MGLMEYVNYYEKNIQGELHACGAACGAIMGGGSEEEIDKLRKYGVFAGMIQGLSVHANNTDSTEMVEKLRVLAMDQLASFNSTMIREHAIFDVLEI